MACLSDKQISKGAERNKVGAVPGGYRTAGGVVGGRYKEVAN